MRIPFRLVKNADRVIRGDVFPARSASQGTLIICHGFKGFKDWGMFPYVGETLSEWLDVITFNFSHNGVGDSLTSYDELEKFAKNTYSRELEDLHAVVDHVRKGELPVERRIPAAPLFLLGHSRGGAICQIYAMDYPEHVSAVLTWNGLVEVDGILSEEMKREMREKGRTFVQNARTKQNMPLDLEILEDIEQNRERFNILERVKTSRMPMALIQGTEDSERLVEGSAKLTENNKRIKWIRIEGGNHTFGTVHPFQGETEPLKAAIRETLSFISEQLKE